MKNILKYIKLFKKEFKSEIVNVPNSIITMHASKDEKQCQNSQNKQDELIYVLCKTADDFLIGFLFSVVRNTISNFMNISNESAENNEFKPQSFLVDSICVGVEYSSFQLTNGLLDVAFQPNLNTFGKWIPWTITTSACSAVVSRSIQNCLQRISRQEKFSFENYKNQLKASIPQSIGFNVSRLYADMILPPKQKLGGKYMRSTFCLLAGNLGSAAITIPAHIHQYPLKSMVFAFLPMVPLCFVENALLTSVKQLVKPLRLVS